MAGNVPIFGIGRVGSKNRLANDIVDLLPPAGTLYEPFCGGMAVSHCAMKRRKYKRFLGADNDKRLITLLKSIINQEINDLPEPRNATNWNETPLSMYLFSYNCDMDTYIGDISSIEYENFYKMFRSPDCKEQYETYIKIFQAKVFNTDRVEATVRNIAAFMRLRDLGKDIFSFLQESKDHKFQVVNKSYSEVPIPKDAVVYADPPYDTGRDHYSTKFNKAEFIDWALAVKQPIFISEYSMPDSFVEIGKKEVNDLRSNVYKDGRRKTHIERLWIPRHRFEELSQLHLTGD